MNGTLEKLRVLAAADPKAARQMVERVLDGEAQELEGLLARLATPGEGRLRQLVANTARQRHDREKVVPHLLRWLPHESDEFARTAIQAALEGIDISRRQQDRRPDPPGLVETYRYVAGRLCHKVRNALPGPMTHLLKIEELAKRTTDPVGPSMLAAAAQMREALRTLNRLVEFNIGDEFFEWRMIQIVNWLKGAEPNYNKQNDRIALQLRLGLGHTRATIRGNDFLLETIFWNLWKNAREAVGDPCRVTVTIAVESGRVVLVVSDNGKGFPAELAGVAFEDRISTHSGGRGRGLLEIADAVQRLSGQVKIADLGPQGLRVRMAFPLENT